MKTKVDPLLKLLKFRQGEAGRALVLAQTQLSTLEQERQGLEQHHEQAELAFEALQRTPSLPEDHALYRNFFIRLRAQIAGKDQEIEAQQQVVEQCREALAEIHKELKTLEKYKENLIEHHKQEKKVLEAKELDEIAGQNHRRQEA